MGNEAIARGIIEAGCSVAAAYPGTPSSEVLESLVKWKKRLDSSIYLEWSVNEKIALETAYGASLAGLRSVAVMKMVGLNVASDPILSAAYLGVRGGMVVVVADDPGPHSSQTEQDSRFFAWFAKIPVLDPSTPAEARDMVIRGFELSEKYEVPVIVRPCLRVCHARQDIELRPPGMTSTVGPFKKNWTRWAAIPKYRLVLHRELNKKLDDIRLAEPESTPRYVHGTKEDPAVIITSGSVSSHVVDIIKFDSRFKDVAVCKIDMPFPAQTQALQNIVDSHEKVFVIEETYPVIELQMKDRRKVMGRDSGDVPSEGELTPEAVEQVLVHGLGLKEDLDQAVSMSPRRPSLCAGCPHRSAFYAIKQVFPDAIYTGDIGCYTLGTNMGAVDTCLCMGASIGMAAGFSRNTSEPLTKPIVATIGDSTFYHAGVTALINAVHTSAPIVIVIMDNGITAMTGGQPTPGNDFLADGSAGVPIKLEDLVKGCGVNFLQTVDPYDYHATQDALKQARSFTYDENSGVSVIVTRRPCIRSSAGIYSMDRFEVNDNCDRCMTCMRDLECPAISFNKEEKAVKIDVESCAGCGFCVDICPSQAIGLRASNV